MKKIDEVKEIILYHDPKPVSSWLKNVFGNVLLQVCESEIIKIKA